jgi:hypothetical protein
MENIMTNKCKLPKKISRQRNLLHNHPLLGKGGTHSKSNKSKRRLDKVNMKKEWLPQNILLTVFFVESILVKPIMN